ncbi:MAG TPA: RNase adapter RapZ [Chroococcales cyanobacterium]
MTCKPPHGDYTQSMSATESKIESKSASHKDASPQAQLEVIVTSFGYKQGPPPLANVVWDVRFLKNPYWVEELRPLTGLDKPVQDYVLDQPMAQEFLNSIADLFQKVLPKVVEHKLDRYIIALGCTGGQHRSTTLVETLAKMLKEAFPQYSITVKHRELSHLQSTCEQKETDTAS